MLEELENKVKEIQERHKRPHKSWGECQLNSNLKQCCCVCKWHIEDHYHCTTAMPLRYEIERLVGGDHCICDMLKGWICYPPEMLGRAFSDWPEHSIGCEMFRDKRNEEAI